MTRMKSTPRSPLLMLSICVAISGCQSMKLAPNLEISVYILRNDRAFSNQSRIPQSIWHKARLLEVTLHEILASIGLDLAILGAGAVGGMLRDLSRKRFKVREVLLSPICGTLAAGYLTPWATYIVR